MERRENINQINDHSLILLQMCFFSHSPPFFFFRLSLVDCCVTLNEERNTIYPRGFLLASFHFSLFYSIDFPSLDWRQDSSNKMSGEREKRLCLVNVSACVSMEKCERGALSNYRGNDCDSLFSPIFLPMMMTRREIWERFLLKSSLFEV